MSLNIVQYHSISFNITQYHRQYHRQYQVNHGGIKINISMGDSTCSLNNDIHGNSLNNHSISINMADSFEIYLIDL